MGFLDLGSIGYSLALKKDGSWESGFQAAEKNLTSLGAAMKLNQRELDRLQKEMFKTSAKMRELESTTGKTSAEYKAQEAKLAGLKTKYNAVEKATEDFDRALAKAGRTSRETAQKFAATAQSVGGSMKSVGTGMTMGVTLPLVAVSAAAIKLGTDFESTMNQVQASTSASADEMEDLRALALKMGADTIFSAGESAEAMLELSKAGMTPAQVKAGALESALLLAAAGGLELADSAAVTASALKQFNLKAEDSAVVANALAGGANESLASVASLREALQQGGSVADAFGQSINGTVGALALMADEGVKGSDAGTSFKQMLLNLQPTTKKQIKTMDDLNLSFVDSKGNFDDITVIAEKLHDKLGNLSEATRNQALENMFGTDAMRAGIVMTGAGAEGIQRYIDATMDQEAASAMAESRMKGMAGAMEQMKGSVETAGITLGTVFAPIVLRVSSIIKDAADKFTALSGSQKNSVLQAVVFAAVLGPIITGLGFLVSGIGSVTAAFVALGVAQGVASGGLTILLGAIAVLASVGVAKYVGAMDGMTAAQRDLRDAQDASAASARRLKDAQNELAGKKLDRREAVLNEKDAATTEKAARAHEKAMRGKKGHAEAVRELDRADINHTRTTRARVQIMAEELEAAKKIADEDAKNAKLRADSAMIAAKQTVAQGKFAGQSIASSRAQAAAAEIYGRAARKANMDVTKALDEQSKALKRGGKNSAEYKAATDKVKVAQDRAKQATNDYRAAAILAGGVKLPGHGPIDDLRTAWQRAADAVKDYNRNLPRGARPITPGGGGVQRAAGGNTYGPASGYPATLHGLETVISYDPRYRENNIAYAAAALEKLGAGSRGGGVTKITIPITGMEMNPSTIEIAAMRGIRTALSEAPHL